MSEFPGAGHDEWDTMRLVPNETQEKLEAQQKLEPQHIFRRFQCFDICRVILFVSVFFQFCILFSDFRDNLWQMKLVDMGEHGEHGEHCQVGQFASDEA